jgi:hypothetical protein
MTVTVIQREVPAERRHLRRGTLTIASARDAKPRRRAAEDGEMMEDGGEDLPIAADPASTSVVGSWNPETRTVEAVLSSGADVERYDYDENWNLVRYVERLRMTPESIRMDRLNSGHMPWLVMHRTHDVDCLIGYVKRAWLDENSQLRAEIYLSDDEESASAVAKIINGTLRGVSVGYWIYKEEVTTQPGQIELREAVDWEVFESSSVIVPADPTGAIRSQTQPPAPKRQEPSTMSTAPAPIADNAAATRAAIAAENKRVLAIQEKGRRLNIDDATIAAMVADVDCTVEAAAVRMVDLLAEGQGKARVTPTPGLQFGEAEADKRAAALSDALEYKLGLRTELSDAARSVGVHDLRLTSIARALLENTDMACRGLVTPADICKRSIQHHMRSMGGIQTAATLPSLLENVMNKQLIKPFVGEAASYEKISRRSDLPDFRSQSVVLMNAFPDLALIPEGDDVTYGKLTDGADTWALATYGKGLLLSFQAMINDDLSGIQQAIRTAPNAVYARRASLFWAMLTANSGAGQNVRGAAMISTGRKNAGTPGALAVGTVNELIQLLMQQLMPGSTDQYMQQTATHILLPAHYAQAWQQISQPYWLPTAAANAKTQLLMTLEVIAAPQLGISGNKPYYVVANENTPFVHGTLQGQPGPQMEQETDFNSGGIKMKVVDHFGVKAVDYHGIAGNIYT